MITLITQYQSLITYYQPSPKESAAEYNFAGLTCCFFHGYQLENYPAIYLPTPRPCSNPEWGRIPPLIKKGT